MIVGDDQWHARILDSDSGRQQQEMMVREMYNQKKQCCRAG